MSNSDSELEEDEEEILVYVEFENCATSDAFSSENLKLDMLGLDSDHPVMQVNGKVRFICTSISMNKKGSMFSRNNQITSRFSVLSRNL